MAKLSGAIFDCDGTIVDSMQMWYGAFDRLLEAHGRAVDPELKYRVESITIPAACELLHEELGMGDSAQALVDEIHEMVLFEYRNHIQVLPGARIFLESLSAAGIPMIVATSTTSWVVREALKTHGLDRYFSDIVCTAEVRDGRDKEFPDVYEEALSRLGTPKESTWVFEDAPFGVQTSRKAGFHVACVCCGHDGRDEDFLKRWSDIFSRNYESISLDAIRSFDDATRAPLPEA